MGLCKQKAEAKSPRKCLDRIGSLRWIRLGIEVAKICELYTALLLRAAQEVGVQ